MFIVFNVNFKIIHKKKVVTDDKQIEKKIP
jgi:hypothetical protein